MNYTQNGQLCIANEGFVFILKTNPDIYVRIISVRLIDYYDCVPEPQPEPEPEEVKENVEFDSSI